MEVPNVILNSIKCNGAMSLNYISEVLGEGYTPIDWVESGGVSDKCGTIVVADRIGSDSIGMDWNASPEILFSTSCERGNWPGRNIAGSVGTWLHTHEDAQVMLASMLVVFSIWWLVRTVLALLINLVCPLLVVLLAVVCVPQLRAPLLGQNYPVVVDVMRNILLKMAENMRT